MSIPDLYKDEKHHPECWWSAAVKPRLGAACICNKLYAAEESGRDMERSLIAERLEACAAGRREYSVNSPKDMADDLLGEANILDSAALIASGDISPMYGMLPSWRWGEAGLELAETRETVNDTAVKVGVHVTHCCLTHGCKYGDSECPVVTGELEQKYPCEWCVEEESSEL